MTMSWYSRQYQGRRRSSNRFMTALGQSCSGREMSTFQMGRQRNWIQYYDGSNGNRQYYGRGATSYNNNAHGWEGYYYGHPHRRTTVDYNGDEAMEGWGYVASEGDQRSRSDHRSKDSSQRAAQNFSPKENQTDEKMDEGDIVDKDFAFRPPHHGGGISTRGGRHHQGYDNYNKRARMATERRDVFESVSHRGISRGQRRYVFRPYQYHIPRPFGHYLSQNRGQPWKEYDKRTFWQQLQEKLQTGSEGPGSRDLDLKSEEAVSLTLDDIILRTGSGGSR